MTSPEVRQPWPLKKSSFPAGPRRAGIRTGASGHGQPIHVGGQIAWDPQGNFPEGMAAQFGATLDNVLAVVVAAGGRPDDVAAMTVFVTDIPAYRAAVKELGPLWRARFGKHYPAMALLVCRRSSSRGR